MMDFLYWIALLHIFLTSLASVDSAPSINHNEFSISANETSSVKTADRAEKSSLHIRTDIIHRFASTQISEHVINTAATSNRSAVFEVCLPRTAFVVNASVTVDGKVLLGHVRGRSGAGKPRGAATKSASKIHSAHKSADCNVFRLDIELLPNSRAEFNVTYQELLQRTLGHYRHVLVIVPRHLVKDLRVDVRIRESQELVGLRVAPFESSKNDNLTQADHPAIRIKSTSPHVGHVSFTPSVTEQSAMTSHGINERFIVEYDIKRQLDAGEVQMKDGYFIHYFAPVGIEPINKNILFLIDASISMNGVKLSQVTEALSAMLDSLSAGDLFNVITFSTTLQYWNSDGLIRVNAGNIDSAKDFLNAVNVSVGTNTNDALLRSIEFLVKQEEMDPMATRVSMLMFITDGDPSTGITDQERILTNIRQANGARVCVYPIALGHEVDFSFLQKLAVQNRGQARQVYRVRDIATSVISVYAEVSVPLMKNIRARYEDVVEDVSLSETDFPVYLNGSEIVVAGRLKNKSSPFAAKVSGLSTQGFMALDLKLKVLRDQRDSGGSGTGRTFNFAQRAWAYLKIKKLQRKFLESTNDTIRAAAMSATIEMSLQYSFLTPPSCLVFNDNRVTVTSPVCSDTALHSPPRSKSFKNKEAEPGHEIYRNMQRSFVDNDPHFLVSVHGISDAVCFDIDGRPGSVYQLLQDRRTDIIVNALITNKNQSASTAGFPTDRTYLGRVAVLNAHHHVVIDPRRILINDVWHDWTNNETVYVDESLLVEICTRNSVTVTFRDGIVLRVLRHLVGPSHPFKVSFLGFYVANGSGLSDYTHGLIGQFLHQRASTVTSSITMEAQINDVKIKSKLTFSGPHTSHKTVVAVFSHRRDMELNKQLPCWHVANNAAGLIKGLPEHYIVPHLLYKKSSFANYKK